MPRIQLLALDQLQAPSDRKVIGVHRAAVVWMNLEQIRSRVGRGEIAAKRPERLGMFHFLRLRQLGFDP